MMKDLLDTLRTEVKSRSINVKVKLDVTITRGAVTELVLYIAIALIVVVAAFEGGRMWLLLSAIALTYRLVVLVRDAADRASDDDDDDDTDE